MHDSMKDGNGLPQGGYRGDKGYRPNQEPPNRRPPRGGSGVVRPRGSDGKIPPRGGSSTAPPKRAFSVRMHLDIDPDLACELGNFILDHRPTNPAIARIGHELVGE